MQADAVKYVVGLKLLEVGIKTFAELASRLKISRQYLSLILSCVERPARHQRAIARICRCDPGELFGSFTSPELRIQPPAAPETARPKRKSSKRSHR